MNIDQKIYKALILLDKGKEEDAITCLKECIELAQDNMLACARAHAILGHVYYELEQFLPAKQHLMYLMEHQDTLETLYDDALAEEIETAKELLSYINA